jgi:hypothetical protein
MATKEIEHELATKIKDKYNFLNIIISHEAPYTLYCVNDLKNILNIKNMKSIISKYKSDKKYKIATNTLGGFQKKNYLNYDGLMHFLATRKKIEALDFCNLCNIKLELKFYSRIEFDTIKCILDAFKDETMESQYVVMVSQDKLTHYYRIDLYFTDYKLAIECDENHTNIDADIKRENDIKDKLNCTFIRYKPYDKNFNIFLLINKIYKSILEYKKN